MATTFILHDFTRPTHAGDRLLWEGLDTTAFRENPVAFYMHVRPFDGGSPGVIGRWEHLRLHEGKLLADLIFDEKNPLAAELKRKVEDDVLRAASLGVAVQETSDDPSYHLPGQTGTTITKARTEALLSACLSQGLIDCSRYGILVVSTVSKISHTAIYHLRRESSPLRSRRKTARGDSRSGFFCSRSGPPAHCVSCRSSTPRRGKEKWLWQPARQTHCPILTNKL